MATQTAKTNEQTQQSQQNQPNQQNQQAQGQAPARGSQQQQPAASRRGGYAPALALSPIDLFRLNPFSLMQRMTQELDRTFGDQSGREQNDRGWAPAIDVTERDGNFIVRAELPGLNPDDVTVEITDDAIVIQGERTAEREEDRGDVHVIERRYGAFYRAIPLPEGAKPEDARANIENGVLEIQVPTEQQQQQGKRREVPIQSQKKAA